MSAVAKPSPEPNLRQAVPFLMVSDMQASLAFYVEALSFRMSRTWTPNGAIEWCWLDRDGVGLMLQKARADRMAAWRTNGGLGQGIILCIMCRDAIAIYHEAQAAGLSPPRPVVGNGLWVTSLTDPDGYRLDFESPADAPEETEYEG